MTQCKKKLFLFNKHEFSVYKAFTLESCSRYKITRTAKQSFRKIILLASSIVVMPMGDMEWTAIFPMKWEGFSDRLCTFFRNCGVVDPSWAELRHFVNFLNSQLQACEASAFCNMKLVGDTLKDFRSFVVQFMILMSRVRNMENVRSRRICGPVPRS